MSFPLLIPCQGFAATYYVDYVGGAATTAGTSTGAAWQYSPGDSRFAAACTGDCATTWTAAGSVLNPGDKVIFKGGVIYTGSQITISWPGNADTVAGRIIFDGDSGTYVTRWGSGTDKAVYDCATTNNGFNVTAAGDYVTINSFEVKNGPTPRGSYLIGGAAGAAYLTVSNNTVHDVGDFALTGGTWGGCAIGSDGGDYFRVQNNTIYNASYGVYFTASGTIGSNIEISGNDITDKCAWGITFTASNTGNLTNWNIFNNTIHDFTYYDASSDPHVNFIWIFGGSEYSVTGINIYNNKIYTDGTAQPSSGGIHLEAPHGGFKEVKIYNNILKNILYTTAIYLTTQCTGSHGVFDGIYIYNNSIYQANGYGGIGLFPSAFGTYNNVNIKNNIIALTGTTVGAIFWDPQPMSNASVDYNLYYTPNDTNPLTEVGNGTHTGADSSTVLTSPVDMGYTDNSLVSLTIYNRTDLASSCVITANNQSAKTITCSGGLSGGTNNVWHTGDKFWIGDVTNAYTLTQWKSKYPSYDVNSVGNLVSDPLFIDVSANAHDLRLASTSSPAYNAGADLSATIGSLDLLGNTRSGAWDIGAYEYTGVDTTPPTLSTVTIGTNGTTLTLVFDETVVATINTGWTITPSGGAATLTYASGSGTNSLVYTISRTIYSSETATTSYTQPGNGIEDVALNDLASITNRATTNNSTQVAVASTFTGTTTGKLQ